MKSERRRAEFDVSATARFAEAQRGERDTVRISMYYVYILMCVDHKTYSGCTDNLDERLERHSKGHVEATRKRLPVELFAYFAFNEKFIAYNFEKYLKSGSGRAFLKKHLF